MGNYDIIRLDRNRHGGGVMFFVIKSLSYNVILSGPSDLEFIVLQIKSFYCAFTVGLFYRPPNAPVCIFDNLLNSLCSQIDVSLLSNFILLGDFNINMTNPHSHLYSKIQSFALSLCLSQIVSEPTHLSSGTSSLIDLVFMSAPNNLISCATIPALANSDHLGLHVSFHAGCHKMRQKRKQRNIWR